MPRGSELIRERREELDLSQETLAADADLSRRTVQKAESCIEHISAGNLRRIADALGLEYEEAVHPDEIGAADAFTRWPWSLYQYLRDHVQPSDLAFCKQVADLRYGITTMRTVWADHLERSKELGDTRVAKIADEELNRRGDQYCQRYEAIWEANPNTLLFSTTGSERSGLCVILPVTDAAYERLLRGEVSFMDIEAADIEYESQNLILDSAVELPCKKTKKWHRITDSLSFTMFYQMALLAKDPSADDFRMIGFGASPINLKRLQDMGFAERAARMPNYGFSICEFGSANIEDDVDAYLRSSTTGHYAGLFKRFQIKKRSNGWKHRMVRSRLQLFSGIAKRHAAQIRGRQSKRIA